jgi:hypothetical protein
LTDDLVKRLDAEINAIYGKHPCGLLNEAKSRIEQLEYFLKVRDDFLDKHYLWQELVISLGEKKDD